MSGERALWRSAAAPPPARSPDQQQTTVYSEPTNCTSEPDQPPSTPADQLTATTPEGLSNGTLTIAYTRGDELVNPASGGADRNGPATDPIAGEAVEPHQDCRTDRGPAVGGYTSYSQPLPNRVTYVRLGEVDVPYQLNPATTQAQLDARVWDAPPTGPAYLITRGAFRLDTLNGHDARRARCGCRCTATNGGWPPAIRSASTSRRRLPVPARQQFAEHDDVQLAEADPAHARGRAPDAHRHAIAAGTRSHRNGEPSRTSAACKKTRW